MRMEQLGRPCAPFIAALVAAIAPGVTRADAPVPQGYRITYDGGTVLVCAAVACPGDGLLRVDATGKALLVTTCDDGFCYEDQCVPPGTYQYGLKTPYGCACSECGGEYYATAQPSASVTGCERTQPAPVAYTGALPWGSDQLIDCSAHSGGCNSLGWSPVMVFNAAVLVAGLLFWRARTRRTAARL